MKMATRARQIWVNKRAFFSKPSTYGKILSGLIRARILNQHVLRYLELQINTQCNQKCKTCFASRAIVKGESQLTLDDIRSLWNQCRKLGIFQGNITGGEPTLHPDLFEILGILESSKNMFSITTNGLLLDRAFILELKKVGLTYLALSLNSLDKNANDDERGTPGHYDHCMDVIGWCKEVNLPVGLSTLFSHQNGEMFEKMAAFAYKNGITLGPAFAVSQGRWSGRDEMRLRKEDYLLLDQLTDKYPSVRSELTTNLSRRITCPGVKEKIFVTAYGDVTSCQLNPVSFGNFKKESIAVILQKMRDRLPAFTGIDGICPVSSDESYIREFIAPTQNSAVLPVRIENHPNKHKF